MTIRGKITLWYVLVLSVTLILTGGAMHYELIHEQNAKRAAQKPVEPLEEEIGEILVRFIVPALAVTIIGGWLLLRQLLRPLDQLTTAAERISVQNLREPLPRTGNGDEVDRLSQVLDAMNQRISSAMHEIHNFMLHASHELKTPLTILHSEIESSMASAQSIAERNMLGEQLDEIQRLTRIVEGLGLLARTNSGQMKYGKEPVNFAEIVRDTVDDAIVLGRSKQIMVQLKQLDEGVILGDRDRLRQMLLNILENATKYNKSEGTIIVTVKHHEGNLIAEIANTGDGIRAEDLPNVFKQFYRGATTSPDPGGVGLGLSIAQSIANAHGGSIAIDSNCDGWTMVRISFPAAAVSLPKLP